MIKWLHLSDIHLNRCGTETRRMRSQLIDFLIRERISCKYLFITGDIRYAPDGDFDLKTVPFLHKIRTTLDVSVENVFIVPGNHDVSRDEPARKEALQTIWQDIGKYYDPKMGIIRESELTSISQSQHNFISVMDEFYDGYPDRISKYHDDVRPHFTIVTDDFNILNVNSTLLYAAGHEKDLIIGTDKLFDALEELDASKPSLLLTHYSYDFLWRPEQNEILKLMVDNNIMLWLSGHEHDDMLRRQRDYFYEFQSGNLLYEGGDTKSCFLVGEFDPDTYSGGIVGYEWDSEEGWRRMSCISRQPDRSRYEFELQNPDSMRTILEVSVSSEEYASHTEMPHAFDKYNPDKEPIPGKSLEESRKIKQNFGGCDSNVSVENSAENEDVISTLFPFEHVNDISSLMGAGSLNKYKGYIYLDSDFAPFIETEVKYFKDGYFERYILHNDTMKITVAKTLEWIIYISVSYNLSGYPDVDERLFHFKKVREYMDSKRVFVKIIGHEEHNFSFQTQLPTKEWKENVVMTDYWIGQMQRISKIEQYFGIKFYLPIKASEDDYLTIDVLNDAVEGKSCRSLPTIPMKNPGFRKSFDLKEKMYIGNADRLLRLNLFGYTFKPTGQYLMPGRYVWSRKRKGWEAEGLACVPVGVDFEVSYEEEMNRELISFVPFEDYHIEFDDDVIPELDGETEFFFENYIRLTHDLQRNRQLFLNYQDALDPIIDKKELEGDCGQALSNRMQSKVTINRMTDHVVSAGRKLVASIDKTMDFLLEEPGFSSQYTKENVGYAWMVMMNEYSVNGHFPISIKANGEGYYDLRIIRSEAESENDERLSEITLLMNECEEIKVTDELPHYDMMRNYMYVVAEVQKHYYESIGSTVRDYVETMNRFIDDNLVLVHHGEQFDNTIAYLLEKDPGNLHVFERDADVITDYNRFMCEAERHFELQSVGMQETVYI